MLSTDDFKKRASTLYSDSITRWRKVLMKSVPKTVKIEIPADQVLPYTRTEFTKWLWSRIQLQAIPCPYCRTPIDIVLMQLDHKTPIRRGGGPELANLQVICKRCNQIKGELTHEEYLLLIAFLDGPATYFRQRIEGTLINGAMGKMMRNYPRKEKARKPTKIQNSLEFHLGAF